MQRLRHLRWYLEEVDLLLLTGGIGPTPDDITRDAVAEVAGVPVDDRGLDVDAVEAGLLDGRATGRRVKAK